ncbi:MAG: bifunctional ornithine acetyltransferase/N-acetylglutamate synthase, partial [Planctomycetales bacterium]|nr:bifunctional ornithine acetyltransferase/N-acetylglutamate synthase [Planctomycetales bacterium]
MADYDASSECESTPQWPQGFRGAALHSGVKADANREDLALIVSDRPCVGAGVYTQNIVHGAPVKLNRQRTPSDKVQAVVVNSGVANACTGEQGFRDAQRMAQIVADACGLQEEQVLVMSTGVIGHMLPMAKIEAGIHAASERLDDGAGSLQAAARGMMTTDTRPKICSREIALTHGAVRVTGLAKGAAMIGPNMATMLAVITTDAHIKLSDAHGLLKDAADESFNCISVEGHMSTSDTVLLLANGAAGGPELEGSDLAKFRATLVEVCEDLAQSIPADGEGATHLITVEVHGCRTRAEAVRISKTVADSPLV